MSAMNTGGSVTDAARGLRPSAIPTPTNPHNSGVSINKTNYGVDKIGIDRIGPFIRRQYQSCGTFQWVREFIQNAIEAKATGITFEVEWEAARSLNILRWKVWDDGVGMSDTELQQYMNNLSAGSKTIDGKHDNFGIGLRISTLGWNPAGVVILSVKDGYGSMVVLKHDPVQDTYGLEKFPTDDGITTVVEIGEYEGIDYEAVLPDEIKAAGHGTAFVLLGSQEAPHTVFGDPTRKEGAKQGIQAYVKGRYFQMPADFVVRVLRAERHGDAGDLSGWPTSRDDMSREYRKGLKVAQWDEPKSLSDWLAGGRKKDASGKFVDIVAEQGVVDVVDSTGTVAAEVRWFLAPFAPDKVPGDVAAGYFGYLYKAELYGKASSGPGSVAAYRDFGIIAESVRRRLWMVVEPQLSDLTDPGNEVWGVQPDDARTSLEVVRGDERLSVTDLRAEWGRDFMAKMPDAIRDAQNAEARSTDSLDLSKLEKLRERFGKRWQAVRVRVTASGTTPVDPDSEESDYGSGLTPTKPVKARKRRKRIGPGCGGGTGGNGGSSAPNGSGNGQPHSGPEDPTGAGPGGRRQQESMDLPAIQWKPKTEFESLVEPGISPTVIAGSVVYRPGGNPTYPHGLIHLNEDHSVITEIVEEWVTKRAVDRDAAGVKKAVLDTYATVAVAKVAHAFLLRGFLDDAMAKRMFSAEALTLALAGIYPEESAIQAAVNRVSKVAAVAA